jgi:hypothetical protein
LSAHHSKAYGSSAAYTHLTILTVTFIAIPTVIIVGTNALIWLTVKISHNRSRRGSGIKGGSVRSNLGSSKRMKKTALMLTLICCTFILCYIPTFVKFILYNLGHEISLFMYLFHNYALSVNSVVNPFIYIFTNNHFRSYIWSGFKKAIKEKSGTLELAGSTGK